jgi:hypothetical protein
VVRPSIRLQKTSTGHRGGAIPLLNEEITNDLCAGSVEALATPESSVSINQKRKCQPQHDVEVLFARLVRVITSTSPKRRRDRDTQVGYSGQVT